MALIQDRHKLFCTSLPLENKKQKTKKKKVLMTKSCTIIYQKPVQCKPPSLDQMDSELSIPKTGIKSHDWPTVGPKQ